MSSNNTLLLHVGYAKTGTTTLQNHLFSKLETVKYLGRFYPVPKPIRYGLGRFLTVNPIRSGKLAETVQCYLHDDDTNYKYLAEAWSDYVNSIQGPQIKMFSHENILRPAAIERTASRLNSLFKNMDVKILFTIRRQHELLMSRLYHDRQVLSLSEATLRQHLSESAPDCIFPCCNWVNQQKCKRVCADKRKVSLPYYNFNKVISLFEKEFGRECIEVLSFEKVFKMDKSHMSRIGKLLGISEQKVSSIIAAIPQSNKAKNPEGYAKFKSHFNKECSAYITEYYKESNQILSERYRLNLDDYAYF